MLLGWTGLVVVSVVRGICSYVLGSGVGDTWLLCILRSDPLVQEHLPSCKTSVRDVFLGESGYLHEWWV